MRRRQFVSLVGAGLATTAFAGTVSGRDGREPPNDNVESTRVFPFGSKDNPTRVDTGEWITHSIGWFDAEGGDRTKDDVRRWLDAVELSALIDGEPVEDVDQYWGEIRPYEEDTYAVWWKKTTPPKSPALYSFTIEFHYPDGFTDGEFVIESGTRNQFTGYYEVTAGNGKGKQK